MHVTVSSCARRSTLFAFAHIIQTHSVPSYFLPGHLKLITKEKPHPSNQNITSILSTNFGLLAQICISLANQIDGNILIHGALHKTNFSRGHEYKITLNFLRTSQQSTTN
jgi:hypothetical protein